MPVVSRQGEIQPAVSASGKTIKPGEVRTTSGTVSAVSVQSSSLVVEAPTAKGMLAVGVTMKEVAVVRRMGADAGLGDLEVGGNVTIRYTREEDRLIGLEVHTR